jgi:hypothetical protein
MRVDRNNLSGNPSSHSAANAAQIPAAALAWLQADVRSGGELGALKVGGGGLLYWHSARMI